MKRLFLALLFLVILPLAALGAGDPPPAARPESAPRIPENPRAPVRK